MSMFAESVKIIGNDLREKFMRSIEIFSIEFSKRDKMIRR